MKVITDEEIEQGLQQCDKCGAIHSSIDLFWNIDWDEHTERELVVIDCMDDQGFDAVCRGCFAVCRGCFDKINEWDL
jgi:ribosomal protein S14